MSKVLKWVLSFPAWWLVINAIFIYLILTNFIIHNNENGAGALVAIAYFILWIVLGALRTIWNWIKLQIKEIKG